MPPLRIELKTFSLQEPMLYHWAIKVCFSCIQQGSPNLIYTYSGIDFLTITTNARVDIHFLGRKLHKVESLKSSILAPLRMKARTLVYSIDAIPFTRIKPWVSWVERVYIYHLNSGKLYKLVCLTLMIFAPIEDWTQDLQFTRVIIYRWDIKACFSCIQQGCVIVCPLRLDFGSKMYFSFMQVIRYPFSANFSATCVRKAVNGSSGTVVRTK